CPGAFRIAGFWLCREQSGGEERKRAVIGRAEPRRESESDQGDEHCCVQPLREAKAAHHSKSYDERVDAFSTIKFVILDGVDQIETRDPANDSCSKYDRRKIDV